MFNKEMENEVKMVLLSSLTKLVIASGIDNNVQPDADWSENDTLFMGHLLTFTLSIESDTNEGFTGYVISVSENKNPDGLPSKEVKDSLDYHKWEVFKLLKDLVDIWVKIRRPNVVVNNYIYLDTAKSQYQTSLAVLVDNLHYINADDLGGDVEDTWA